MKNKNHDHLRVCLAIALCLAVAMPANLMAWGAEGHIVVAKIAASRLSPSAKAGVKQLLGRHSLDSVANYADQVRSKRPETAQWHFVDIPKDDTEYNAGRDCKSTP